MAALWELVALAPQPPQHDAGEIDFAWCQYGTCRLRFRGPKRGTGRPYLAVLGGSATLGRFVPEPFPLLLEEWLGAPVLNLGQPNAGPDVFLGAPDLFGILARASAVIVQLPGALNLSNPFYSVHPRRNDRVTLIRPALRKLFPEVDFADITFTRHLAQHLRRRDAARFRTVEAALQRAWDERMATLLSHVTGPVTLLWAASAAPGSDGADAVTPAMIARLAGRAEGYVEVVTEAGTDTGADLAGLVFRPEDRAAAAQLPGAEAHRLIARALRPIVAPQLLRAA
jgi:hypothetical protein